MNDDPNVSDEAMEAVIVDEEDDDLGDGSRKKGSAFAETLGDP